MGIRNSAILFLGYEQFELFTPEITTNDLSIYLNQLNTEKGFNEHGSILHRPLDCFYSSSHEEYLIGILLGESGAYKSVNVSIDDLLINLTVHRERLRDIFDHKEPTLFLFNQQD